MNIIFTICAWLYELSFRYKQRSPILFCYVVTYMLLSTTYAQLPLFHQLPPSQTNVTFRNEVDENEQLNVLAYEYFYNGGGVAVGDFNNDGLQDIFYCKSKIK